MWLFYSKSEGSALYVQAKVDKDIFLGYSVIAKAFGMFNFRKHTIEELIHVKFDEDSCSKDSIDHSRSNSDELISFLSPESHYYDN